VLGHGRERSRFGRRARAAGSLFALALTCVALPARARPDEPAKETTSTDPQAKEKSRALFLKGVAQLRAQDWKGARASFEAAWSLVEHPSILLNLGIARLRTDDPALAEQDLSRFLSDDAGASSDEVASARAALTEARAKLGTVRIVGAPPSARVLVDDKPVTVRPMTDGKSVEARLKVGTHSVKVEADGISPNEQSVDVTVGSKVEIRVESTAKEAGAPPPPPESDSGPSTRKIVGWSLAGFGGIALVAGGFLGLRAMSLSSDYSDRQSPSFQDKDVKSEGVAIRTGADVALVTGLVAGTVAVILLFTDVGASRGVDVLLPRFPRTNTHPALLRW
jgi:hypothetical protein